MSMTPEKPEKPDKPDEFTRDGISRRAFVAELALAAGAVACARTPVMTTPTPMASATEGPAPTKHSPNRTLNVAIVGAGGMGMENMLQVLKGNENVVAICDVDYAYVERSLAGRLRARDEKAQADARLLQDAYTKATKYGNYREMLDRQRDLDAVVVATPDHLHAVIANAAMKAGKHVYVQKPLTYSVHEARTLARTARETGVVTQMGNQGHSMEGTRRINELIAAGVIGPVREVHVWTDRPLRYWPQGIPRPTTPAAAPAPAAATQAATQQQAAQQPVGQTTGQPTQPNGSTSGQASGPQTTPPPAPPRWSMRTVDLAIQRAMADNPQTPPQGLNWDLFLGPAKEIPYHPVYHPFSWRGWPDFGVSAIGDMGAHLIDQPYWALGLGFPTSVVSTSTPWGGTPQNPGAYPLAQMTQYEFAARGNQPPVKLYWYDGGLFPFITADVPRPGGDGGGGVFVGEKGYITYETYGNNPKVYPEEAAARAERVPKTFARVDTTHEVNWARACKGDTMASSPFEYAARLTEVMLLGVVALRAGAGQKIMYDGANMRITNNEAANQHLTREYRSGWTL
ncbi:MAG TPA: Gfo/Idh/MocA family oxidoreductase [Gemmatimonadaceae bacterium]|nr:Gfo/Idh/MocA family oxidoreductase [Gemmatimonadaceae bacterium]